MIEYYENSGTNTPKGMYIKNPDLLNFTLGEDYKRASQFMDMLGMDNDQLIFSGILQDSYLKSKYMKVDNEHSDIVENQN